MITSFKYCLYFILLFLLWGCNGSDLKIDPNYPSYIKELSDEEQLRVLGQLEQMPVSGCVAVSRFGFPLFDLKNELCNVDSLWRISDDFETINNRAMQAFSDYAYFLNIEKPADVKIARISTINNISYEQFSELYPDSAPTMWLVTSAPQVKNELSIRSAILQVLLSPSDVVAVGGNWFNDFLVPANEKFDEQAAKDLLLNVKLKSGFSSILINENTFWYASKKMVVPKMHARKMELRVCWVLYPKGWSVTVDVYSGEIVSSEKIS